MKLASNITFPAVGLTGFETPLDEEERVIQHSVHRFAQRRAAPAGPRARPHERRGGHRAGLSLLQRVRRVAKLGLDSDLLAQLPPETAIRIESMIGEEMGWGDAGLAVSLVVTQFPLEMAKAAGNQELVELSTGRIGCWMITHPDKGTDVRWLRHEARMARGATG